MQKSFHFREYRETTFVVAEEKVRFPSPLIQASNPDYFVRMIGVQSIDVVRNTRPISLLEMKDLVASLGKRVDPAPRIDTPISLMLFSDKPGSRSELPLQDIRGFSVISWSKEMLIHQYFEGDADGAFRSVEGLAGKIDGPLTSDSLRLLLFGHWKECILPPVSTAYVFVAVEPDDTDRSREPDQSLISRILLDPEHNSGCVTLGLHGAPLYEAYLDNDPVPLPICGDDLLCSTGGPECVYDSSPPYNYCSHLPRPPNCAVAQIGTLQYEGQISSTIPIEFNLLRRLRDEFMCKSKFGREYMGYYYLVSRNVRYDLPAVIKYVTALPSVYVAVNSLLAGAGNNDQAVIVTSNIATRAKQIIDINFPDAPPEVQAVFTRMRTDLAALEGKSKTDFLAEIGMS